MELTQKQEEIKELLTENKSLRLKVNSKHDSTIVNELERKISEQENIIEVLNNELETFKIQQDTNRMHTVMLKTAENFNSFNMTKSQLNRSVGNIKIPKNSNKNFVVKSHISREKMRRDKMLKDLKEIQHYDYPNYESLKRLFKQLMDIFGTDHIGEMVEKSIILKEGK